MAFVEVRQELAQQTGLDLYGLLMHYILSETRNDEVYDYIPDRKKWAAGILHSGHLQKIITDIIDKLDEILRQEIEAARLKFLAHRRPLTVEKGLHIRQLPPFVDVKKTVVVDVTQIDIQSKPLDFEAFKSHFEDIHRIINDFEDKEDSETQPNADLKQYRGLRVTDYLANWSKGNIKDEAPAQSLDTEQDGWEENLDYERMIAQLREQYDLERQKMEDAYERQLKETGEYFQEELNKKGAELDAKKLEIKKIGQEHQSEIQKMMIDIAALEAQIDALANSNPTKKHVKALEAVIREKEQIIITAKQEAIDQEQACADKDQQLQDLDDLALQYKTSLNFLLDLDVFLDSETISLADTINRTPSALLAELRSCAYFTQGRMTYTKLKENFHKLQLEMHKLQTVTVHQKSAEKQAQVERKEMERDALLQARRKQRLTDMQNEEHENEEELRKKAMEQAAADAAWEKLNPKQRPVRDKPTLSRKRRPSAPSLSSAKMTASRRRPKSSDGRQKQDAETPDNTGQVLSFADVEKVLKAQKSKKSLGRKRQTRKTAPVVDSLHKSVQTDMTLLNANNTITVVAPANEMDPRPRIIRKPADSTPSSVNTQRTSKGNVLRQEKGQVDSEPSKRQRQHGGQEKDLSRPNVTTAADTQHLVLPDAHHELISSSSARKSSVSIVDIAAPFFSAPSAKVPEMPKTPRVQKRSRNSSKGPEGGSVRDNESSREQQRVASGLKEGTIELYREIPRRGESADAKTVRAQNKKRNPSKGPELDDLRDSETKKREDSSRRKRHEPQPLVLGVHAQSDEEEGKDDVSHFASKVPESGRLRDSETKKREDSSRRKRHEPQLVVLGVHAQSEEEEEDDFSYFDKFNYSEEEDDELPAAEANARQQSRGRPMSPREGPQSPFSWIPYSMSDDSAVWDDWITVIYTNNVVRAMRMAAKQRQEARIRARLEQKRVQKRNRMLQHQGSIAVASKEVPILPFGAPLKSLSPLRTRSRGTEFVINVSPTARKEERQPLHGGGLSLEGPTILKIEPSPLNSTTKVSPRVRRIADVLTRGRTASKRPPYSTSNPSLAFLSHLLQSGPAALGEGFSPDLLAVARRLTVQTAKPQHGGFSL